MTALGVPPRKGLGVALSACTPRSFLAAGYPLRSLTRKALIVVLFGALYSCQNQETSAQEDGSITSLPIEVRSGEQRTYYTSGAVEWQYNYLNDTLEGSAAYFDSLGHKREEHWYSKGVLKSLVVYDPEGFIVDTDFRWKEGEFPKFNSSQIELTTADTVLRTGTEYRFRVKVPGIPYTYFQESVTNATIAKAPEDQFVLRTKNGPTTCINLTLSVGDSLKMPFGQRCFSVVP